MKKRMVTDLIVYLADVAYKRWKHELVGMPPVLKREPSREARRAHRKAKEDRRIRYLTYRDSEYGYTQGYIEGFIEAGKAARGQTELPEDVMRWLRGEQFEDKKEEKKDDNTKEALHNETQDATVASR